MVSGVQAVSNAPQQNEPEEQPNASASADASVSTSTPVTNDESASPRSVERRRPKRSESTARDEFQSTLSALSTRYHEHALTTPIEMVGFWAAVSLPFLYLPLLVTGLGTSGETMTFLALLALNVVALLAGHSYNRD